MREATTTIFKQTTIYGIGNIIRKLSGVVILPIVKGFTSEDEFGVWMLLETVFIFTQVMSGLGVKSGFLRWYNEMLTEKDKKSLFFTVALFNYLVSIVVVAVIGVFLYLFSLPVLKYDLSGGVIIAFLASSFFRLLHEFPFLLLKIQYKPAKQTLHSSINVFLLLLFTLYFLYIKKEGFMGVFLAQLVANVITFTGLIPIIKRNIEFHFKLSDLKEMIIYGFPLALSNVLTTVLNLSDRHIINQFYNPAESGNYGLSFKVANLLEMVLITSFISSYTYHYFRSFKEEDSQQLFNKLYWYFFLIITFGGLCIILFSKEIIWLSVAGDEYYMDGIYIVPVLILALTFSGIRQFLGLPLNKHKRTVKISQILVSVGVLNIALNLALVPVLGRLGAAISTLLVQFISMVWFYHESNKYEDIDVNLKQSILLIGVWFLFVWFGYIMPYEGWINLFIKAGLIVLYVLTLLLLRIIQWNELVELIKTIKQVLVKK